QVLLLSRHRITFNTRYAGRINRIHVTQLIPENPSGASTIMEGDRMYKTELIEREVRHAGLIETIHDHHINNHNNQTLYVHPILKVILKIILYLDDKTGDCLCKTWL